MCHSLEALGVTARAEADALRERYSVHGECMGRATMSCSEKTFVYVQGTPIIV